MVEQRLLGFSRLSRWSGTYDHRRSTPSSLSSCTSSCTRIGDEIDIEEEEKIFLKNHQGPHVRTKKNEKRKRGTEKGRGCTGNWYRSLPPLWITISLPLTFIEASHHATRDYHHQRQRQRTMLRECALPLGSLSIDVSRSFCHAFQLCIGFAWFSVQFSLRSSSIDVSRSRFSSSALILNIFGSRFIRRIVLRFFRRLLFSTLQEIFECYRIYYRFLYYRFMHIIDLVSFLVGIFVQLQDSMHIKFEKERIVVIYARAQILFVAFCSCIYLPPDSLSIHVSFLFCLALNCALVWLGFQYTYFALALHVLFFLSPIRSH